jgi:hypothetical protein
VEATVNPDSGKLHEIAVLDGIERIAKGESKFERSRREAENLLARAERRIEAERKVSSEPLPGTEVPKDWPRFQIGEKIGPIKGWWFDLVDVDVEAQEILIKPFEPTRGTVARRTGNPRKRRKVRGRRR